jgi:uncharacterized protein (DUF433 family)
VAAGQFKTLTSLVTKARLAKALQAKCPLRIRVRGGKVCVGGARVTTADIAPPTA